MQFTKRELWLVKKWLSKWNCSVYIVIAIELRIHSVGTDTLLMMRVDNCDEHIYLCIDCMSNFLSSQRMYRREQLNYHPIKYITRIDITARGGIRDKTWKDSNKRRQYWKTNSFTIDLFTSAPLSSISTRHPSKLRILEISVQFTGWLNPPSAMNCNVLWFVFANFQETSNHEFIATLSQLSHNN